MHPAIQLLVEQGRRFGLDPVDAGWRARNVSLNSETVTFERGQ
jgi:hypothetical protein